MARSIAIGQADIIYPNARSVATVQSSKLIFAPVAQIGIGRITRLCIRLITMHRGIFFFVAVRVSIIRA